MHRGGKVWRCRGHLPLPPAVFSTIIVIMVMATVMVVVGGGGADYDADGDGGVACTPVQ